MDDSHDSNFFYYSKNSNIHSHYCQSDMDYIFYIVSFGVGVENFCTLNNIYVSFLVRFVNSSLFISYDRAVVHDSNFSLYDIDNIIHRRDFYSFLNKAYTNLSDSVYDDVMNC